MRSCASLLSLALLVLPGCSEEALDHGFSIRDARFNVGRGLLRVSLEQDLRLSQEAVEAVQHGVALTISLEMELRSQETLNLQRDRQYRYEIRYLPLSQHYQLTDTAQGEQRTFPRLRHALAALGRVDLEFPLGPLTPGEYIVRGRVLLDQARLPGPMQLPAALSPTWRHQSEWSQWLVTISA